MTLVNNVITIYVYCLNIKLNNLSLTNPIYSKKCKYT